MYTIVMLTRLVEDAKVGNIINTYNMGTSGPPDMYTSSPRTEGMHIR